MHAADFLGCLRWKADYGGCLHREWAEAMEQLQMEKGVCSITRTYTPELVRQRAFATPQATFQIAVRMSCNPPILNEDRAE